MNVLYFFISLWLYAGTCTFVKFTTILSLQMGVTALMCAAQKGNIDVINALVKAGSKVNEKDEVIV